MTPEELNALLQAATDPTTAPEALLKIREAYEAQAAEIAAAKTALEAEKSKTAALTDTNQRLFLRVTGAALPSSQDDEQKQIRDMTPEERDNYFKNLINKEDNTNGNA